MADKKYNDTNWLDRALCLARLHCAGSANIFLPHLYLYTAVPVFPCLRTETKTTFFYALWLGRGRKGEENEKMKKKEGEDCEGVARF